MPFIWSNYRTANFLFFYLKEITGFSERSLSCCVNSYLKMLSADGYQRYQGAEIPNPLLKDLISEMFSLLFTCLSCSRLPQDTNMAGTTSTTRWKLPC